MELTVEILLSAYCQGLFPMADSRDGPIYWYRPDPRTVIPLDRFHIPRTLARTVRRRQFDIRRDTAFGETIQLCADRRETWISGEIIDAYGRLFEAGYAHSVECWKDGVLVGGLYGVAIGGAFFGESMFSLRRDASKVALVHLVEHLRDRSFVLLDTQYSTPHLVRFGALEIPSEEYLALLARAIEAPIAW